MEKIKVMISSTVSDLVGERDAIANAFKNIDFVQLIGVDPVNTSSFSSNSRVSTTKMASDCDLYLLILGKEFGYESISGKSATEMEFDAAYRNDPTKILVFLKEFNNKENIDSRQREFIDKVCNYYDGYWRSTFEFSHNLIELVLNSFTIWLKERAEIGKGLDYLDHFIRITKQMKPEPNAEVYYKLTNEIVELEYSFFGKSHVIQFTRKQIYENFWGCINQLNDQFERWV